MPPTKMLQPAKRHRSGGGTARTRDKHTTPLSSSSLPSTRKRPRARAMIAKQSNPAKKSKNKASKSSDVKEVDESTCYICKCDGPEYTPSNHKSFRLRAPPVPVCGTECEAAYLAERGCTHFINKGRGKHHRFRIQTHATSAFPLRTALLKHFVAFVASRFAGDQSSYSHGKRFRPARAIVSSSAGGAAVVAAVTAQHKKVDSADETSAAIWRGRAPWSSTRSQGG
jgi:hypothetical protein